MRHRNAWGFGFDGFDPPFWWSGGRRPSRGRGRRRRQWFESGDMKYVILRLLQDKPMHGYEVMKALEEQCQGCYKPSPGAVYPTLQWLEDEGLVECEERNGKKIYSITADGEKFLKEHKSTVEEIFDRLEEMIDSLVGDPMPDVNRAVTNLVASVYKTTWKLRGSPDRLRLVAEALEEARKKIRVVADGDQRQDPETASASPE